MHIAGFGATHWSSLNRIVRSVFLEIEFQNKTWGQTEGQKDRQKLRETDRHKEGADDRDFRNYSMILNITFPFAADACCTSLKALHRTYQTRPLPDHSALTHSCRSPAISCHTYPQVAKECDGEGRPRQVHIFEHMTRCRF